MPFQVEVVVVFVGLHRYLDENLALCPTHFALKNDTRDSWPS